MVMQIAEKILSICLQLCPCWYAGESVLHFDIIGGLVLLVGLSVTVGRLAEKVFRSALT